MAVEFDQSQLADFLYRSRKMTPLEAEREAERLFGVSTDACKEAISLHDRAQQIERDRLSLEPSYDERNTELKELGYEILVKAGEGGGGVVYKALQKNTGQVVAIKLMARRFSPAKAGHLQQEIARLGELRNLKSFVHLYDAGITKRGRPFFVMQYIDGENLVAYCNNKGFTLAKRLNIMAEVCDCVAELHRHGLIHRDLKPENIWVTQQGEPRILDLGLAQAMWADPTDALLARLVSEAPRTLDYSAPEQDDIRYRAATACDCYALGRILYELLTGDLPDKRDPLPPSQAEVAPDHVKKLGCRNAGELSRRISGGLEAVVLKALAVDPGARYQEPIAMAADLRAYLANHPVSAVSHTRLYLTQLFVRRNPRWVALTALLQVALVATALYALMESRRARSAEQEALAQAKESAVSGAKALAKAEEAEERARAFRETREIVERLMRSLTDSSNNRLWTEAERWIALYQRAKSVDGFSAMTLAPIAKNAYESAMNANHPAAKEFARIFRELNENTQGKWRDIERHQPGLWSLVEQTELAQATMLLSSELPPNLESLRSLARTNIPHLGRDNDAWGKLRLTICAGTPVQARLINLAPELKGVCQ